MVRITGTGIGGSMVPKYFFWNSRSRTNWPIVLGGGHKKGTGLCSGTHGRHVRRPIAGRGRRKVCPPLPLRSVRGRVVAHSNFEWLVVVQKVLKPLHQLGRRMRVPQEQQRHAAHEPGRIAHVPARPLIAVVSAWPASAFPRARNRTRQQTYGKRWFVTICSTCRTVGLSWHRRNSKQNAVETVACGVGELGMLGSAHRDAPMAAGLTRRVLADQRHRARTRPLAPQPPASARRTQVGHAQLDFLDDLLERRQDATAPTANDPAPQNASERA